MSCVCKGCGCEPACSCVKAHVWEVCTCVCKVPYAACMCSVCIYLYREGTICIYGEGRSCMRCVYVCKMYSVREVL